MNALLKFSFLGILLGCSSVPSSEIVVPTIDNNFYLNALAKVEQRVEDDPTNLRLLEQQLFYCEAAGWPPECGSALKAILTADGMSESLFQRLFAYHHSNDQIEEIVALVSEWRGEYDLTSEQSFVFIEGLRLLGKKVRVMEELATLLSWSDALESLEFAADQYLLIGDSLKSIYYYSKVKNAAPERRSMIDFGKLLLEYGYATRGVSVLQEYTRLNQVAFDLANELANLYATYGYSNLARKQLLGFATDNSVALTLASLYQRDGLTDSALIYTDSVLSKDENNLAALKYKASLYYQKGWLATALTHFEHAYSIDTTDTVVSSQIADIQRKIAYLQRKKFEESKAPLLEINSKKIINE